jgi:hypothetical protein
MQRANTLAISILTPGRIGHEGYTRQVGFKTYGMQVHARFLRLLAQNRASLPTSMI